MDNMRILILFLSIWYGAAVASDEVSRRLAWNEEQIQWHTYQAGVAQARSTGKPVLVVLYAPWCPTCHMYEAVFDDPDVAALTNDWVMIRIDVSANKKLAGNFAEDGLYTPRTYVIGADGIDRPIYSKHRMKHFFPPKPDVFVRLLGNGRELRQETSS